MPGLPGVNPAPQPMDLSASGSVLHAASQLYLLAAVALPVLLAALLVLRVSSAPARWTARGWPEKGGRAWWMPYELFVVAFPVAAVAVGELAAVSALASDHNRSNAANKLIVVATVGMLAMGVSAARSRAGDHPVGDRTIAGSPYGVRSPAVVVGGPDRGHTRGVKQHLSASQVAELAELLEEAPVRAGAVDEVLQAAEERRGMTLRLHEPVRRRPPRPSAT